MVSECLFVNVVIHSWYTIVCQETFVLSLSSTPSPCVQVQLLSSFLTIDPPPPNHLVFIFQAIFSLHSSCWIHQPATSSPGYLWHCCSVYPSVLHGWLLHLHVLFCTTSSCGAIKIMLWTNIISYMHDASTRYLCVVAYYQFYSLLLILQIDVMLLVG